jgi:hypothetical protein
LRFHPVRLLHVELGQSEGCDRVSDEYCWQVALSARA